MRWNILCTVIDNWGDIGVALRLAHDLAARGEQVTLWCSETSAAAWMRPLPAPGVSIARWDTDLNDRLPPAEVLLTTFGCDLPAALEARLAQLPQPPLWINLEYLSAEPYVERSHGLPSPRRHDWQTWFYYPGFTPRTGGLLREPDAVAADDAPTDSANALIFAYADSPLDALPQWLAPLGLRALAAAGAAQAPCLAALPAAHALPLLAQPQFDAHLRASCLAIVRGEDSLLRAIWAGVPFIWDIYKQHDGVHRAKLEAFMQHMLLDAEPALAAGIRAVQLGWNRLGVRPARLPDLAAWRAQVQRFRSRLLLQPDLTTQLLGFVASKLGNNRQL